MDWVISAAIYLFVPGLLLLVGWLAGSANERAHLRSLARREGELGWIRRSDLRSHPGATPGVAGGCLVIGEVVIATDYLKSFLARLRKLVGGEMGSYLSLLERARREAIARMLEDARRRGYNAVGNVRFETSDVSGNTGQGRAMIEVMAFGTAYRLGPPPAPAPTPH